MVERRRRVC
jgi:hypothetical protein